MNCPYCNKPAMQQPFTTLAPKLWVATENSNGKAVCYDEPIIQFECENLHTFFGKSKEEADRDAEELREHDRL